MSNDYHLIGAADEQTLKNDPVIGAFYQASDDPEFPGSWDQSVVFLWITATINGVAQPGFWIIIGTASTSDLAQNANCALAWNGDDGSILGGTFTGNDIAFLSVSPVPAGAKMPSGIAG